MHQKVRLCKNIIVFFNDILSYFGPFSYLFFAENYLVWSQDPDKNFCDVTPQKKCNKSGERGRNGVEPPIIRFGKLVMVPNAF